MVSGNSDTTRVEASSLNIDLPMAAPKTRSEITAPDFPGDHVTAGSTRISLPALSDRSSLRHLPSSVSLRFRVELAHLPRRAFGLSVERASVACACRQGSPCVTKKPSVVLFSRAIPSRLFCGTSLPRDCCHDVVSDPVQPVERT